MGMVGHRPEHADADVADSTPGYDIIWASNSLLHIAFLPPSVPDPNKSLWRLLVGEHVPSHIETKHDYRNTCMVKEQLIDTRRTSLIDYVHIHSRCHWLEPLITIQITPRTSVQYSPSRCGYVHHQRSSDSNHWYCCQGAT